jgi:elongation factor G
VAKAVPGDLRRAKVEEIHFDAVLHDAAEDDRVHLAPLDFPYPVHGLAIEPKRHGDEQRMWEILGKLVDEDPCLRLEHAVVTNETIVYGLGELHLRVLLERLREVYKFEVNTRPPRIAYRETITGNAEGHHRHKQAAVRGSSARCSCASSRWRAGRASSSSIRSRAASWASSSPRSRKAPRVLDTAWATR